MFVVLPVTYCNMQVPLNPSDYVYEICMNWVVHKNP